MRGLAGRPYLLDVSRLVWRLWRGGLPTGIDRVCLAYVDRFHKCSRAVVQWRGVHLVLSPKLSDRLFGLVSARQSTSRPRLALILAQAALTSWLQFVRSGSLYLNVGHTGLNEPSLAAWISARQLRAVYLVHDLIPITHPQFCRAGEADKHRRRMDTVLVTAAGVIGNSQATLAELAAYANGRQKTMPPSLVAWISGNPVVRAAHPHTFHRPHFVTLGTIEVRKNHALLLAVWRRLVAALGPDAPILLIVGKRGWEADAVIAQLDDLGELSGYVRELPRCADNELARFVAGACAVLMPSFIEGFGLPVTEALESGTPVIATDLAVYREIAGELPTYLSPDDVGAWAEMIMDFMGNGAERQRQLTQIAHYDAPIWTDHFATVERWLNSLSAVVSATHVPTGEASLNLNGSPL